MKKLNLDETWRLCLSMWRWIAKEKRAGNISSVGDLKYEWTNKHGFRVDSNCFFCEYESKRNKGMDYIDCNFCPAVKVDPDFGCMRAEYHYKYDPIAFYNKLVSLNRKRLAKRKSKC